MEVEGRAMEVEGTAASGNSKPLLRSHVEDYCNVIVEGMKVGEAMLPCITAQTLKLVLLKAGAGCAWL